MNRLHALSSIFAVSCATHHALATDPETEELIIEMAEIIQENYVFPEMGAKASEMLRQRLDDGAYEGLDEQQLAQALHVQLRDLTEDLHFGIQALPEDWTPPSADEQPQIRRGPVAPFGFTRVERLGGNIGYIELRGFNNANVIGDTLEAAMQLIQGSSAVIFDLRRNGGGDPAAVQLITSYIFDPDQPVHLNSLYSRPNDETTEYWTHDFINTDLAMPDVPVYVLTSARTFSAAEEFSYNLKNLQRATIVGETTGGGAHPVDSMVFNDRILLTLPTARAISPITGTNWEGTGVVPHREVDEQDALDTALSIALESSMANGDESARWGLASIRARLNPIECPSELLAQYAGDYGARHVRAGDNSLEYRRDGNNDWSRLICVDEDQFVIENFEGFIMEFDRDEHGRVSGIIGHYPGGRTDSSVRDN